MIEKKHLPDVDPAVEMQKNGTDIGRLNSKLLQKIEELTLYLIEKDKKDKQQTEQIEVLIMKINQIKKGP